MDAWACAEQEGSASRASSPHDERVTAILAKARSIRQQSDLDLPASRTQPQTSIAKSVRAPHPTAPSGACQTESGKVGRPGLNDPSTHSRPKQVAQSRPAGKPSSHPQPGQAGPSLPGGHPPNPSRPHQVGHNRPAGKQSSQAQPGQSVPAGHLSNPSRPHRVGQPASLGKLLVRPESDRAEKQQSTLVFDEGRSRARSSSKRSAVSGAASQPSGRPAPASANTAAAAAVIRASNGQAHSAGACGAAADTPAALPRRDSGPAADVPRLPPLHLPSSFRQALAQLR